MTISSHHPKFFFFESDRHFYLASIQQKTVQKSMKPILRGASRKYIWTPPKKQKGPTKYAIPKRKSTIVSHSDLHTHTSTHTNTHTNTHKHTHTLTSQDVCTWWRHRKMSALLIFFWLSGGSNSDQKNGEIFHVFFQPLIKNVTESQKSISGVTCPEDAKISD